MSMGQEAQMSLLLWSPKKRCSVTEVVAVANLVLVSFLLQNSSCVCAAAPAAAAAKVRSFGLPPKYSTSGSGWRQFAAKELGDNSQLDIISSRGPHAAFWRLRGGFIVGYEQGEGEEEEYDDYDSDDSLDLSSDEDDEEEDEEEEEEGVDDDYDDDKETSEEDEGVGITTSSSPVKVIVQTGLNCPLIDETLEVTASRTRDIASIRKTVSRQMRGRPPVASVRLLLGNCVLKDDEILNDLAPDEDEEEEEEENDDDDDDDGLVKVRFTLDTVPPVDPKFGVDILEQTKKMSTADLLEAYAANAAALHENAASLINFGNEANHVDEDSDIDEDESDHDEFHSITASIRIRRHALAIKEGIVDTMSRDAIELLAQTDAVHGSGIAGSAVVRSHRKDIAIKGGASTHVKRVLQRNLNINWPDTIRNFILFLFFGYFGGRDPLSRTIMYLGAPLCFLLQARPAKIAIKQIFYTLGEPPAILLSLLPAPQQAIMSLDYESALEDLYGREGKSLGASWGADEEEAGADDDETNWSDDDYENDYAINLDDRGSSSGDPYDDLD